MSRMYKNLLFNLRATVKELSAPTDPSDAVRLTDLNETKTVLSDAIASGDASEAAARSQAVQAERLAREASIAALEAAYRSADAEFSTSLAQQFQSLATGFSVREPVFAIANAPIVLNGLGAIATPSYSGAIADGARVLTIAQGGDPSVAHPDNRVWIARAGAWVAAPDVASGTTLARPILVSIENGSDNFTNTVWIIIDPTDFQDNPVTLGTTPLKWARWQGNDRVIADGTTIIREGITFRANLNGEQLISSPQGISLTPNFISRLLNLAEATGQLAIEQIAGLANFITGFRLDQLAPPDTDLSVNNKKITDLADPTLLTDAINLRTYRDGLETLENTVNNSKIALSLINGTVVDGDTVFSVTHNLGSMDVVETIYDTVIGETIGTDFIRNPNNFNVCSVVFRGNDNITPGRYRLLLQKIA